MDEVIEELRQRNESVPVPLDLPDEDDLVLIEEALFLPLPKDYRAFLLQASDIVCGSIEPATVADPNSHTHLPHLAAQAWSVGLPRQFIPICEHQDQYHCIAPDGTVLLWDTNTGELTSNEWETIWHWTQEVWLGSSPTGGY